MKRYAQWLIRARWWVIALVLAATAGLGLHAPQLKVTVDPSALVPADSPSIRAIDRITATFGSKYMMVVGITPKQGDIFQPAVLGRVERITQRLSALPQVVPGNLLSLSAARVRNIQGHADGFDARPMMAQVPADAAGMAALKAALASNPVYLGTVVSEDFRTAAILVELKEGYDGVEKIVAPVAEIVAAEAGADVDIAVGGNPVYIAKTEGFGRRINLLFPLAVLLIGLLHFEAFRTRQGLVLPLVTALMSVTWGMGAMGLLKQSLDIFNSPTPILILAIAAGHAVQLLKRYYEDYEALRSRGVAPKPANVEATVASLAAVGPVMLVAGAVAALGFFSLVVFEVPTIRSFGIFTGVGVLSAVVLEMSFIPAVRSLLSPPSDRDRAKESARRLWDRIPAAIAGLVVTPRGRRTLGVVALLALAAFGAGMGRVVIDNSSKHYFAGWLDIQQDDRFLNERLGGTNTLYLMVDGGAEDAVKSPQVMQAIERLQRHLEARKEVGKTLSIVDFVARMDRAMHGDDARRLPLPQSQELISQYLFLYSISGDARDFDAFIDTRASAAKVTVLLKTGSNAAIKHVIDDIRRFAATEFPPGVALSFGGDTAMTIALSEAMVYGKLRNIVQICVAVFLISALVFRSVLGGFIVLLPVLLAVCAVFGTMGLLGIPLNIPNALISAMAVGIGADYAIYLLYRFRERVAAGDSDVSAARTTLGTAGKACLFVATAVAGGYGVLALSLGYNVHLWLSLFIIVAMAVSALASLTLVPALVLGLRPAFVFAPARRRSAIVQVVLGVAISAACLLLATRMAHAQAGAPAGDAAAAALMQKGLDSTKVADSLSNATFTLVGPDGQARRRLTTGATKLQPNGVDNMRLVQFLAPADIKGTSTLLVEHAGAEDDLWVYLPALKKVRRLTASNKKDSFFGTEFSYGDMIGHKVDEWSHRVLREEPVDDAPCHVVESLPRTDAVRANSGYSRRVTWLRKDSLVPVRVEAWDLAGQPLKRMHFSELRPAGADGRWQPMRMKAENLQTGHHTLIELTQFQADLKLDAQRFTPRALEP
jgi:hypothetical protein